MIKILLIRFYVPTRTCLENEYSLVMSLKFTTFSDKCKEKMNVLNFNYIENVFSNLWNCSL